MQLTALSLAWAALKRQKRRTILTMLAMAIGTAAVITVTAAGEALERLVLSQLEIFGSDTLSVETNIPRTKKKQTQNALGQATGIIITTLKDPDIKAVQRHPNIAGAYGMVSGQEVVSYEGELVKVLLMGHGWQMPEVERSALAAGRFYTAEEEASAAPVAVLGSKVKTELFGGESAIDKIIYIRGKAFRVIGVLAPRGAAFFFDLDSLLTLPTKTMQQRLLGIDYVQAIFARMQDAARSKATVEELAEVIRANHRLTDPSRDDFHIHTAAEAQQIINTITSGITLLLLALVAISLLVGGVGIMNIMYVSVAERTFEIGLRQAVGARRRDIGEQFLTEAVLITTGGGVAGIMMGMLLTLLIYAGATAYGFKWVYAVSPAAIGLAVGFSALIGVVFGIAPARRAAALSPIEALRRE